MRRRGFFFCVEIMNMENPTIAGAADLTKKYCIYIYNYHLILMPYLIENGFSYDDCVKIIETEIREGEVIRGKLTIMPFDSSPEPTGA